MKLFLLLKLLQHSVLAKFGQHKEFAAGSAWTCLIPKTDLQNWFNNRGTAWAENSLQPKIPINNLLKDDFFATCAFDKWRQL